MNYRRLFSVVGALTALAVTTPFAQAQFISSTGPRTDRISFNGVDAGTALNLVESRAGKGPFLISAESSVLPGENAALIFNSSIPTPGSEDLGSPNEDFNGPGIGAAGEAGQATENPRPLRRILVVADDLTDANNDDLVDAPTDGTSPGRIFHLDFSPVNAAILYELTVIDIEGTGTVVRLYGVNGGLLSTIPVPPTGDNGVALVPLGDVVGVRRLEVEFNTSGGLDNIRFDCDCNQNGFPDPREIAVGLATDLNLNGLPDDCDPDCNNNGIPDDFEINAGTAMDLDSNGVPDECDPDCDMDGIPDVLEEDCNSNGTPDECEVFSDCNMNEIPDECELAGNDCNSNGIPDECEPDCNLNGTPDDCDIANGSPDCDSNGLPDVCDPDCDGDSLPDACEEDCNANGTPDDCEVFSDCNNNNLPDECELAGNDCNSNGLPDECEPDCNSNGTPDDCDIANGAPDCNSNGLPDACDPDCDGDNLPDDCEEDCNSNGMPDDCEVFQDCNNNNLPDECELAGNDCNSNGLPDECEPDCNSNGTPDDCDITNGAPDCNSNGLPDDCDPDCDGDNLPDDCEEDCNSNGTPDDCEAFEDCNMNEIPDECDLAGNDCNSNGTPDECEPDCNSNGVPDDCDITNGAPDCNSNGLPDDCDVPPDCNSNGIPDECEDDCDLNGTPDDCDISTGGTPDCDMNGTPDVCDLDNGAPDVDGNGIPDSCDPDCDNDGIPDAVEDDCDMNDVPDDCQNALDCNDNNIPDVCDLANGSPDVDQNGVPDECDPDCDGDGIPDAAEPDCDNDGTPDDCDDSNPIPDERCIIGAETDENSIYGPHNFPIWFGSCLGNDWYTVGRAEFTEFPDDTARMTGIYARTSDPSQRWFLNVELRDRVDPGDANYPPVGSPNLNGLEPSSLAMNGGPIDPSTWHYYETIDGTLLGLESFEGGVMRVTRRGSAFQVGVGASQKNADDGASGWIEAQLIEQPAYTTLPWECDGDININFADCPSENDYEWCVRGPEGDAVLGSASTSGLWISGVHYDILQDGVFNETADGKGIMIYRAHEQNDPSRGFDVSVVFCDRSVPGDANYPPLGSPKQCLDPAAYVANGGPIDMSNYRFYESTYGTLDGFGDYEGAIYRFDRRGESFQIGEGANCRDTLFGASGWLDGWLCAPADNGTPLDSELNADINVGLVVCPDPCAGLSIAPNGTILHYDFSGQSGTVVSDQIGSVDLTFQPGNGTIEWISDAHGDGVRLTQSSTGTAVLRTASTTLADNFKAALQMSDEMTVQVYFNAETASHSNARLLSYSHGTAHPDRNFTFMGYPDGGACTAQARLKTLIGYESPVATNAWNPGDDVVLAMTYDAGEGFLRIFIEGVEIASQALNGNFDAWTSDDLMLGNESTLDRAFSGVFYDVKVWNRALDANELTGEALSLH